MNSDIANLSVIRWQTGRQIAPRVARNVGYSSR